MLLNPVQTILPLLSDLARFREEPGGLVLDLKGLDVEWDGQRVRFLDGRVRLSLAPPSRRGGDTAGGGPAPPRAEPASAAPRILA